MKKLYVWLFALIPFYTIAQQQAEYNQKGDEAMKRLDYSDARMWYEEGVLTCDSYSIDKLTSIWLLDEKMRLSMRSIMNKCLNCLTEKATKGDTTAMQKLSIYYGEGIGIPVNEEVAAYWTKQLHGAKKEDSTAALQQPTVSPKATPGERMKFFIGYAYSIEAPYGIKFGGIGNRIGWYGQFKTNLSFEKTQYAYPDDFANFKENVSYQFIPGKKKTNTFLATAGMVVKFTPWWFTSFGGGYGKRDLLWEYETHNKNDYYDTKIAWAKNKSASYKGAVLELDMMFKIGSFYLSAGTSTLSFEYMDLNAGIGVFF